MQVNLGWLFFSIISAEDINATNSSFNNIQYIRNTDTTQQLDHWLNLDDTDLDARLNRAEALFFIPESADIAISLLHKEADETVRAKLLLAIGKNGNASHSSVLLMALQQRPVLLPSDQSVAATRALSIMASRGKLTTNRIELSAALLQQRKVIDPILRRLSALVISQLQTPALPIEIEQELFKAALNETDGEAASHFLVAISQLRRTQSSSLHLKEYWKSHSAWEVRAAYAQHFACFDESESLELSRDPHQQVRSQLQRSLAHNGLMPEWRAESLNAAASSSAYQAMKVQGDPRFHEALDFIHSWHGEQNEIISGLLDPKFPTQIRVAAIQSQQQKASLTTFFESDTEIEVRRAAGIRLSEISKTAKERKNLLQSKDPYIIAGVATVLAKEPKANSERDLWASLSKENDDWVNLAILHALVSISKQDKSRELPSRMKSSLRDFSESQNVAIQYLITQLAQIHGFGFSFTPVEEADSSEDTPCGMRLMTSEGEVRIEFDPIATPNSLLRFSSLLNFESSFTNGWPTQYTPQFTVQFGHIPPENYILDEHTTKPFTQGSVGLALRTPDSGGSQFFISFQEQPSLIGEYTHIGEITYGLNTVLGHPYLQVQSSQMEFCKTSS
jgi:peptidyl-prolyl cis-trans isomerase B (cyclophilin B)